MVTITQVTTKKQQKEFINFPLRLYKGNKYFVPPLYSDELLIFSTKSVYFKTCESVCFLATRDGKTVGRIQGIIQKQYNEIHHEKRFRFGRFDSIDDQEVADALFKAVEDWGKSQNLDTICGPLGYSDLDREGLLIKGFDELSTFEEQYNYEYYQHLIEHCGYAKEVDWVESKLYYPEQRNEMIARVAERSMQLNKLHLADYHMSKKAFITKYRKGIFYCLDECYKKLYGTVPFTKEMEDSIIAQFLMIVNIRYLVVVCDENENVVSFGLCFPGIGKAVQKSGGHLTIPTLLRMFKLIKHPQIIDLGLVAVLPEYQAQGVNAVVLNCMLDMLGKGDVQYCETNLNLENNAPVLAQWKYFKEVQHKRRRSYVKKIN